MTHHAYYNCNTGTECGQVQTVTDALGHATMAYTSYDAYGKPLTITDPNNVTITLGYDAEERLTSRQIGTEITHYSYWAIGLLQTVTRPDGSTLTYTYDPAHRLTQISDSAGNSLVYQLDGLGNHLSETAYYPGTSPTVARTHSWAYNTLGQLYQDDSCGWNRCGWSYLTYSYDGNGNSNNAIVAPLSRNTTNVYDGLKSKNPSHRSERRGKRTSCTILTTIRSPSIKIPRDS